MPGGLAVQKCYLSGIPLFNPSRILLWKLSGAGMVNLFGGQDSKHSDGYYTVPATVFQPNFTCTLGFHLQNNAVHRLEFFRDADYQNPFRQWRNGITKSALWPLIFLPRCGRRSTAPLFATGQITCPIRTGALTRRWLRRGQSLSLALGTGAKVRTGNSSSSSPPGHCGGQHCTGLVTQPGPSPCPGCSGGR